MYVRVCSSHQWVCVVIMYVALCVYQCVVSTTPLLGVTCQSLLVQCLVASVLGARAAEWFLCQLRKRRLDLAGLQPYFTVWCHCAAGNVHLS